MLYRVCIEKSFPGLPTKTDPNKGFDEFSYVIAPIQHWKYPHVNMLSLWVGRRTDTDRAGATYSSIQYVGHLQSTMQCDRVRTGYHACGIIKYLGTINW